MSRPGRRQWRGKGKEGPETSFPVNTPLLSYLTQRESGNQILSEITANHLSLREPIPPNHHERECHFIRAGCQDGKKLHPAML